MLKIITIPDPRLRETSKKIMAITPQVTAFIKALNLTLEGKKDPPGVGLSAIQVGKPLRIFSTFLPHGNVKRRADLNRKKLIITTFINPEIVAVSRKRVLADPPYARRAKRHAPILEGCLSIPGLYGPVWRHEWVDLRYYDLQATSHALRERRERFSDFTARVIQHEMDHLNGVLFVDRSIKDKLPIYEERNGKMVQISLF